MLFMFNASRKKSHYHISDGENSLCKMELGQHFKHKYILVDKPPEGKRLCSICGGLQFKTRDVPSPKKNKSHYKPNPFYKSPEWKRMRYKILAASNGKCNMCWASKKDGAVLNVDHIKPIKYYKHLSLVESNLQVLCASCNWGKGNS